MAAEQYRVGTPTLQVLRQRRRIVVLRELNRENLAAR